MIKICALFVILFTVVLVRADVQNNVNSLRNFTDQEKKLTQTTTERFGRGTFLLPFILPSLLKTTHNIAEIRKTAEVIRQNKQVEEIMKKIDGISKSPKTIESTRQMLLLAGTLGTSSKSSPETHDYNLMRNITEEIKENTRQQTEVLRKKIKDYVIKKD